MGSRGAVLTEVALTFGLLILPAIIFQLELIRMGQYRAILHIGCFRYLRSRVMGETETTARLEFFRFLERGKIFGMGERRKISRGMESEILYRGGALRAHFRYRYSTWWPWPNLAGRFQVTRSCRFSCSR